MILDGGEDSNAAVAYGSDYVVSEVDLNPLDL